VIRAHQPGSEPIDIPETIPNPVVVPKPTPTPIEPAPKEPVRIPDKVPLERRPDGCDVRKVHPRDEQEAARIRLGPEICVAFQKDNFRRSLCDQSPAQAEQ
jgi:hypothetical protein